MNGKSKLHQNMGSGLDFCTFLTPFVFTTGVLTNRTSPYEPRVDAEFRATQQQPIEGTDRTDVHSNLSVSFRRTTSKEKDLKI